MKSNWGMMRMMKQWLKLKKRLGLKLCITHDSWLMLEYWVDVSGSSTQGKKKSKQATQLHKVPKLNHGVVILFYYFKLICQ